MWPKTLHNSMTIKCNSTLVSHWKEFYRATSHFYIVDTACMQTALIRLLYTERLKCFWLRLQISGLVSITFTKAGLAEAGEGRDVFSGRGEIFIRLHWCRLAAASQSRNKTMGRERAERCAYGIGRLRMESDKRWAAARRAREAGSRWERA